MMLVCILDTRDNYKAHHNPNADNYLTFTGNKPWNLLENATSFIQECDTAFNQGNKADLKQVHPL